MTSGRQVKQGDLLAPTLFNLARDTPLFEVDDPLKSLAAGPDVKQLVSADDTTLFAPDLLAMQEPVDKLVSSLRGLGLEITQKKFHLLHLGGNKKIGFSYVCTKSVWF